MKLRMASIGFLLVCGAWNTEQLMAASTGPQSEGLAVGTEGVMYEHRLEKSRFDVGAGARDEVDGPYERVVGDKGVFLVDTITGAALAVPNASPVPKGTPVSKDYPQPLTKNPGEHSAVVRAYLLAAGVPAAEVSGTHVTTTMAGGGPVSDGVQPSQSKLLFYTTHLERSLGGIPVEGSYAFAALDSAGQVITEGVYWPAISASVVHEAQALKQRLTSTSEKAAFLADVQAKRPDVGKEAGTVKIVHTSAGYHGEFEANAVYSVVVRSAHRGKAEIVRFDDTGAPVLMADELPSGKDSKKRK
jgi:hypothetical protein